MNFTLGVSRKLFAIENYKKRNSLDIFASKASMWLHRKSLFNGKISLRS